MVFRFLLILCAVLTQGKAQHPDQTLNGAAVPLYPPLARVANVQGEVILQVTTDAGRVERVERIQGHPLLSAAAISNVRSWTFLNQAKMSFKVNFRYKLSETCKGNPSVLLNLPFRVTVCSHPHPPID